MRLVAALAMAARALRIRSDDVGNLQSCGISGAKTLTPWICPTSPSLRNLP